MVTLVMVTLVTLISLFGNSKQESLRCLKSSITAHHHHATTECSSHTETLHIYNSQPPSQPGMNRMQQIVLAHMGSV